MRLIICLSLALLGMPLEAENLTPTVGIIGDSLALGAASHPALSLDVRELTKVVMGEIPVKVKEDERLQPFGIKKDLSAPTILWPGIRDYNGSMEWTYSHLVDSFTHSFFTTPQYSWSYLVPRKQNVEAKKILISAELGARVEKFPRLVDRILDANQSELPSKIFVFFTGNDVCAHSMNGVTSSEDFGEHLFKGMQYLLRNGKAPKEGTKVYVPHFLPVSQLITKESILNYQMPAFGEKASCRDLRKNGFQPKKAEAMQGLPVEALYLSAFLPPNFSNKCPTLFNHDLLALGQVSFFSSFNEQKRLKEIEQLKSDFLSTIATRIRNYRMQTDRAVKRANEWRAKAMPGVNVSFHSIKETGDIEFEGEDFAPDCFHLNINGHVKVAKAILKGLEN